MAVFGRNRTTVQAPLFRFPFLRGREVHRMRDEEPRMIPSSLVSVVDDDESVRESLPDLLREFGFTARSFSSAEEFLASEYVSQTNCLILDVGMPGMSGPELQRELRLRGQHIPIVLSLRIGMKLSASEFWHRAPLRAFSSHSAILLCLRLSTRRFR